MAHEQQSVSEQRGTVENARNRMRRRDGGGLGPVQLSQPGPRVIGLCCRCHCDPIATHRRHPQSLLVRILAQLHIGVLRALNDHPSAIHPHITAIRIAVSPSPSPLCLGAFGSRHGRRVRSGAMRVPAK
jgi:hypothetical protein